MFRYSVKFFLSLYYSRGVKWINLLQENLVSKNFDIKNYAQEVDKEVIEEFEANVTKKVLMIRFYWARKGTTAAPKRGIYGPLISAISVELGNYIGD